MGGSIQNAKMNKSKGLTLIEILTVVFLGTIIIMTGYTVYLMSYKSYQKNSANSELTQNARIALERMSREIRQARDIVTVLPNSANGAPSAIQIQDGHGIAQTQTGVPANCNFLYITYSLDQLSGDLYRKLSYYPSATVPITCVKWDDASSPGEVSLASDTKAQKITVLQFWGPTPSKNLVTIHLTVSDGSSYTFETMVRARNLI